jgi:hypothetical protein
MNVLLSSNTVMRYIPNATSRSSTVAGMFQRILLALALVCFFGSRPSLGAVVFVPPSAGGEGIQAALDGLPEGGQVALSEGKYLIREPVILRKDHQTLRGRGVSTVLYLVDAANCPVVVLGSPIANAKDPIQDVRLTRAC